jgi:hypothetical protein
MAWLADLWCCVRRSSPGKAQKKQSLLAEGVDLPDVELEFPDFVHFQQIANGYWHLRVPFVLKKAGLGVDIKTHMSVCRVSSGYICIDCVSLSPEQKAELDQLTCNGEKIVAVLNTHPFHTMAIKGFHAQYPSSDKRRWFGCPRHLKMFQDDADGTPISWAGDLNTCEARTAFEPELSMRVPAGCEFVDPKPSMTNHFATVFVLHRASRTLHVDDCLQFFDDPSFLMRMAGKKVDSLHFHFSLPIALCTPCAPKDFQEWMTKLCNDWEFDNLLTAHIGNCYCDANQRVKKCLQDAEKQLSDLAAANSAKIPPEDVSHLAYSDEPGSTECG